MTRRGSRVESAATAPAVFLLLLVAAAARAQANVGSVEIGAGGGRFFGGSFAAGSTNLADHRLGADDDILQGFWLGTQLTTDWGLEVAVRRTVTHVVEPAAGIAPREPAVAKFIPATVELSGIRSLRRGNFLPYAGFGVGMMNVEFDTDDPAVRDVNRVCFSATLGARFYATRWLGFRIDLRERATYLGKRREGFDRGWADYGRWFFNSELLAGLFLSFGGH
jgi:opacity protein-like surface antigen